MNLGQKARIGIRWTALGSIVLTTVQFIQHLVLAWILIPDDFGNYALLMLFIGPILTFFENGYNLSLIQKHKATPNQKSSLFFFLILLSISFWLIILILRSELENIFHINDFSNLLYNASFLVLLAPLCGFYSSLLLEKLDFKSHNTTSVVSFTVGALVSILLAYKGCSVLALIYGMISEKIIYSLLGFFFANKYFKPLFRLNLLEIRQMLRFGSFQTLSALVNFTNTNIDKALIGGFLTTHELGCYYLAWNLMLLPMSKINPIINRVTFPVFSKINNNKERLEKYYEKSIMLILIIAVPIYLILGLFSTEIISFMYGEKWIESAGPLSILFGVGILKSLGNPGGSVLLAKGRSDINLYWNIFWMMVISATVYLFLKLDPSIIYASWAQLVSIIAFSWIWHYLVFKYGRVSYKLLLKELTLLLLISSLTAVIVYITNGYFLSSMFSALLLRLFVLIVLLGLVYTYMVYRAFPKYFNEYFKLFR